MGKITKTMQPKHEETLSPWLKDFVQSACTLPLPLLPDHIATFPTRWPFPRGDLYHWIPLLNRFDNILECFSGTYKLNEGPQTGDLGCEVLLHRGLKVEEYGTEAWDMDRLRKQGYGEQGDRQLIETILKFTRVLLEHCGNRSIYASSNHLNDLLHATDLSVIIATLGVGSELAKRYQASVKRIGSHSRHVSTALLANHYNIALERVQLLASPFVKTPLISLSDAAASATPGSAAKGKDKIHTTGQKNAAPMFANDLSAIVNSEPGQWNGWGDIKISYTAVTDTKDHPFSSAVDRTSAGTNLPSTPTPLRRSTTMGGTAQQTPRSARQVPGDEASPSTVSRSPAPVSEQATSSQKVFDLPQSVVASSSIYDLLARCPADAPPHTRYEYLNRVRIAKALLGSVETRQQALAIRLLAITNLAYIHPENVFMEKVMRQDIDETRRYQLVYQLAEIIHPTSPGSQPVPLWVQSIALALLEAISYFQARYQDVLSALNANVNHGILLYVIRKAVAGMKDDEVADKYNQSTEVNEWRKDLFSLTQHLAMSTRVGAEMVSAGLMDVLVEIMKTRSNVAQRNHATILSFIDGLIWSYQNAFHAFFNGDGLDAISELLVTSVKEGTQLADAGRGTQSEYHSSVVDYDIPFHHQQTLKWLLKFMHHMMTNSYSLGGNTDRLLRNLVDKSDLLASLREIMQHTKRFGSVLWTNSVTVLSDFINNDPTSFAAIAESRMIVSFLESVTGSPVPEQTVAPRGSEDAAGEADDAPQENNDQVTLEPDDKPHPPPEEELAAGRDRPLARGILTSPDAMLVVPQVLNSISLNNVGLRMVVSSRAFESYFEMFESPKHVNCLEGEQHLASSVGESFDELCRHHPALRSPISDAVIDMVARVRFLGKDKAETSGWGAKLVFDDANGNVLTADHGLPGHLSAPPGDSKGKEKASTDDADVDMLDGAVTAKEEDSSSASSKEASKPAATAFDSITPYVHALGLFLTTYLSNNTMKTHFVQRGGIELLLDIAELPSLPYDFNESNASRKLFSVISQLVDHSPVLGLPALLKRAQAALDSLESFATDNDGRPYFAPFVLSEKPITLEDANSWDTTTRNKILTGTKVVRALLNAQSFLKTLYECFPSSPRSSSSVSLYPINFYDYYLQLIKSIGPLLRAGLTEEGAVHNVLPQHWWAKKVGAIDEALAIIGRPAVPASPSGDDDETFLPDDLLGNFRAEALPNNKGAAAAQPKRPTKQEQATARYKNFETLRVVLHSMVPSSFPFFQQLGKAILPRRGGDTFSRQHHIDLAKGLSATIIDQLKPSMAVEVATPKDYHYWIIMLHTLSEMLIDATPRSSDRSGSQIIMPVYLAFVEQGGLEILTTMARRFADRAADQSSGTEPSAATKICSFGLKRALDLFATVVDGKTMADSAAQFGLIPRSAGPRPEAPLSNQMVLDARMAIFPVVREIWDSALMEKTQPETLSRVIDILKIVAVGSDESGQSSTQASDVLKRVPSAFNWRTHQTSLSALSRDYDDDLAREAVYRANGNQNSATEYCRAHAAGTAGSRNPVPTQDAYFAPPPEPSRRSSQQGAPPSSEPMALDAPPELDNLLGDAVLDELEGPSSEESDDDDDDDDEENDEDDDHAGEGSQKAGGADLPPKANESAQPTTDPRANAKKTLDDHREQFRKELISRSLDIVRAHPHSAIEVSELISAMVFPQDIREDVGETLTSAITSLSFDSDEVESDANGSTIAAYAHLFALLLRDNAFLTCNIDTLRANVSTYVGFLKLSPTRAKDDLPPWIPYILLIVEILLAHDEKPIEATWKAPTSENEVIKPAVIEKPEAILSDTEQSDLLERILDILPRLGQEDTLAISVLRVLVVLTRKRSLARTVGEKKNLQRLFVMAKQLAGAGVNRLKDTKTAGCIMIILRHVVEDEETTKQIMRAEVRNLFDNPQRNQRNLDVTTYLRNLSAVALRAPDLFVEITNDMTRLTRWSPVSEGTARAHYIALKETEPETSVATTTQDQSVEPTVQATEDLSLHDIKQSTEAGDKEMTDAPKPTVSRPIIENPDGVVHFLLCELLNYREVDDKEPIQPKDSKAASTTLTATSSDPAAKENTADTGASSDAKETKDSKDKKSKPSFKADEHPIFIYRCFLLNCLAELLQSYNRAKVEFIDFKRSAPLQTNTPVKPRSSVLNYLIHDLLCQGGLENPDTVLAKKKMATSNQAQQVLVALMTKTGEKAIDKHRERFEYDDDPDLLFVRKFALDTILKAYERASTPEEPLETRYTKMQCLAELMNQVIGEKERDPPGATRGMASPQARSQAQLRRMMYEKGYLDKLTWSIADLDLNHVGVKRAIKHVLRVLRVLTDTAKELSRSNVIPSMTLPDVADDEIASSSSMSDIDDDREETPDLYRNSALGMLEPRGSDDESEDEEDDDDDEEMYDDEYGDELEYGEEEISDDGDNGISDDDDEELGEMGEIEGLHGDPGVVEVVMDDDDDMEDDDDEMSDDMESQDMEDRVDIAEEILDEDGNPIDDDGASDWESESDEEEEDDDDEIDYGAEVQDLDEAHMHGLGPEEILENLTRAVVMAPDGEFDPEDMEGLGEHYIEDDRGDEDDDDDEDMEEDEYIYDEDYPHDEAPPANVPSQLGWDTLVVEPFPHAHHGHRHRHAGHRSPFPPAILAGGPRDPLGGMSPATLLPHIDVLLHDVEALMSTYNANANPDFRSYFSRGPRANAAPSNADDGINPLLRRTNQTVEPSPRPPGVPGLVGLRFPPDAFGIGAGRHGGLMDSPMAILNDIVASLPVMRHGQQWIERYQEEARMVFGGSLYIDKAQRLLKLILSKLIPPAFEHEKKVKAEEEERRRVREEERKKREEEERRVREAKEAKEAEEKAERERKEAEERDAQQRLTAEALGSTDSNAPTAGADPQAMEGVESHGATESATVPPANVPRVVTTIRGEEVDITELGIDPEYLAALPEEFREEVIAQTVSSRRSQAREDAAAGEQRRQAAGGAAEQEMDAASILLTFPPELRHEVLLDQGEDIMDQLPADMAAQVRLSQRAGNARSPPGIARRPAQQLTEPGQEAETKVQRKTVVQMLDKPGIATLLRLMFISQYGSIRNYLFSVLADVCENRQNRLEVISTVLLILQEGSTDMDAVERSFSQLSLKAKKPKDKDADPKTPQGLKRTLTSLTTSGHAQTNSEISPLLVVHQCLDLLQDLSTKNPHIPMLFLTEHESVGSSLKRMLSRKGTKNPHIPMLFLTEHESVGSSLKRMLSRKGKAKDYKAHKYAINALLSLLDRELVMESSVVMAYLADLLNKITVPLATIERRRREAAEKAALANKKVAEAAFAAQMAAEAAEAAATASTAEGASTQTDANDQTTGAVETTASATPAVESSTAVESGDALQSEENKKPEPETSKSATADDPNQKKGKQMQVPVIPPHYLTLVVKIFVARECSSKTFQNTISAIKNLSSIPGTKVIFGQELVRQARALSERIVLDLDELLPHIKKATTGTEIQGVALSKFSPGASEQNKLLRVLTALDHLFTEPKKKFSAEIEYTLMNIQKQDLVHSLYHNSTFSSMWDKLSECLRAIHKRENMVNVATILLPLIESLMVVCKNTATADSPAQVSEKEMLLSSPPPESRMAGLFFNFTEDHRRILNELVRNNPKLMSGTFALLVKNPKVLEFDNKRNYFNRSVHSRASTQRSAFASLQLAVRREHVFHDSFRSLYFKSGDEMKYGKLNIRFHGEEGVDAGGVTREWFQVLARQMFDANYALFIPQIQWFWRAIRSFDKEELAKLLQFVTGTSKVPLNGFKELEGMNGVSRFNIHRDYGNKERLPSSHTCFNQLDLPEYESYETLRSQLMKAITAGSDYFGFA
ncbi:E3 ubiquitin-protein ligase TOM1-like like [Verticillium longisporum]|uniref:E3 ubiquitin-protein ligase TOM1-like like n=1 Tax=Verticillium longisporum TaxID=100787 RepID=A0A8I2ZS08_VERLO|nr:E3 ubiquitin-protein ligase TOM1-like like [Verticillium longisporum]